MGADGVKSFLASTKSDGEHEKFMRLFYRQNTTTTPALRDPIRLRALANVLPPQQRKQGKPPVYKPRYTRAFRRNERAS